MPGLTRYELPGTQGYMEMLPRETPEYGPARGVGIESPAGIGMAARSKERARQLKELVAAESEKSKLGMIPAVSETQKATRRQHLISQASRHGVPQNVLANQIAIERLDPTPEKEVVAPAIAEVQSSKILPGGLVQLVRKDGTVDIVPATKANQEMVKQAETRGAELQGLRAGERAEAKSSSKLALESFKGLQPIKTNIRNMDEAISLLDAGAETGPIAKRFPSIRAASVKLRNVQDRLGLDVIANTTFGALSESELAFALDSALPTGLNAPELKEWLITKRDTQSKLSSYLEEAALFLGTPGNTIADFLGEKRAGAPPTPPAAGVADLSSMSLSELQAMKAQLGG